MRQAIRNSLTDLGLLAGTTGLEPATSCVTGMRSNQLNYVPGGTGSLTHWATASLAKAPGEWLSDSHAPKLRARQWSNESMTQFLSGGRYPARTDDLLLVRQTL